MIPQKSLRVALAMALLLFITLAAGCGGSGSDGGTDTPPADGDDNTDAPASPPAIAFFEADSQTVSEGESVTLTWQVANATRIEITPDVGVVYGTSTTVAPVATTTYTLTATSTAGEETRTLTITVIRTPQSDGPVTRGGDYEGFSERFNRYYTDSTYAPRQTIYVSPDGSGDGTAQNPAAVTDALDDVAPGTMVYFLPGEYNGCYELVGYAGEDQSGTYDDPVVLYAERNADGSRGVTINCCNTGRATCINLEHADYVAVDGFELVGGSYGVRAVGAGFDASDHQKGLAVLNCEGHDQYRDPFFTGQSDWAVFENNLGYNAGSGDGHGLYISNGSDWNIVRHNELHSNVSSDFQINADPNFTCADVNTAACDALAGSGEGGRGASDYMLVEANFFHHGLAQGANFTSVRHSTVRNNIFALYARHGVSFWQETDNPDLGSSDNIIQHNFFIAQNHRQMLQFVRHSTRNHVANNFFLGVTISGDTVSANPSAVWMEVDGTVGENDYAGNVYLFGGFDGRTAEADETVLSESGFNSAWFTDFPTTLPTTAEDFRPTALATFLLDQGALLPETPTDRDGILRQAPVDIGPFEVD